MAGAEQGGVNWLDEAIREATRQSRQLEETPKRHAACDECRECLLRSNPKSFSKRILTFIRKTKVKVHGGSRRVYPVL